MQNGDIIRITYIGKVKEADKEMDKAENVPIIVGAGNVIKGVDEALMMMHVGEKKIVEIPPDKAFGPRKIDLIKLVPLAEFRRHGQSPVPGMTVEADNMRGRVMSVSSGRVQVDFNHPMSGKTLVYNLEITKQEQEPKGKVLAVVQFYTKIENIDVSVHEKEVDIKLPHMISQLLVVYKKKIADDLMKFLGFEKVKFYEVFEKGKEEPVDIPENI